MSHHEDQNIGLTPGDKFGKFVRRKDVRETLLWAVFYTAVFVWVGSWLYPRWMPNALSTDMKAIERLMVVFTIISAPVCGLVLSIATYTFRHGVRGNTPPEDGPAIRTNRLGVAAFSAMAGALTLVAVIYGITEMNSGALAAERDAKDAMVVEVIGNQWVWNFKYPDLGIESHELNLPVGKPVKFLIHSVDVNHSFWPVQLGVKADANAVSVVQVNTTPNKVGHIDVKCAELCGLYHAYMETDGNVMTESDFNNWVSENGGHSA
jgi:cytochrome c oxidase subunit 2